MLGAASLLAPRPEAFLAVLIPTGLGPAVHLLPPCWRPDTLRHGLLAVVFTLRQCLLRRCGSIARSNRRSVCRFEKRDLVEGLVAANSQTEALNQALEFKVQERTAELLKSAEQLRAGNRAAGTDGRRYFCAHANWNRWDCWRGALPMTSITF